MKERSTKAPLKQRVKSSILSWFGVPIELTTAEFWSQWANLTGAVSKAGTSVTADSILRLDTAWACVKLIAETIATLPCQVWRRMPDGSRKVQRDHDLYRLLHARPNYDMTAVAFWTAVLASMLLWGNAYVEKVRIGPRLTSLNFLLPARISYERRPGTTVWWFAYIENDGTKRWINEDDMWHIPAFNVGGKFGISTIRMGVEVFGAAAAAETSANAVFANMLSSSGYFEIDKMLTKEQRELFRAEMTDFVGSPNTGKFMLLEHGMKFSNMMMNPTDAQLLQTRGFSIEQICRWFGVPPFMVGHATQGQTNWGTGIESQQIGFLMFTLRSWLVRVEQSANASLLAPEERDDVYVEFNVEGLIRADSKTRGEVLANKVNNGLLTRDEARSMDNLGPIPGGTVATVQSGLMDLSVLDKRKDLGEGGSLSANVQSEALNGAQVTALLEIVKQCAAEGLPPDSAQAVIAAAFPLLTAEQIGSMINPLAAFTPKPSAPKPTPPVPPGGDDNQEDEA